MTKQRDLKQLIRERQTKTGESYSSARQEVLKKVLGASRAVSDVVNTGNPADMLGLKPPTCIPEAADGYDCVLPKGHRSNEHGDDHQNTAGTWWNVGQTAVGCKHELTVQTPDLTKALTEQGVSVCCTCDAQVVVPLVASRGFGSQLMSVKLAESFSGLRAKASKEIGTDVDREFSSIKSSDRQAQRLADSSDNGFVSFLDEATFEAVKMERLPCGHKLRHRSEMLLDLKALWGVAGIQGWEQLLEEERQKHRTGRCAEAIADVKLLPKYDESAKRMTMVLADMTGRVLWPKTGAFIDPPAEQSVEAEWSDPQTPSPSLLTGWLATRDFSNHTVTETQELDFHTKGECLNSFENRILSVLSIHTPEELENRLLSIMDLHTPEGVDKAIKDTGGFVPSAVGPANKVALVVWSELPLLRKVFFFQSVAERLTFLTEYSSRVGRGAWFPVLMPEGVVIDTHTSETYSLSDKSKWGATLAGVRALFGPRLGLLIANATVDVTINGKPAKLPARAHYCDVLLAGGYDPTRTLSITYRGVNGEGGTLWPKKNPAVEVTIGMRFSIADTSNA